MKVSKINKFFRKVGEWQVKHRWLCLFALLAWTLVCLSGMRNFRSESNNNDWIVNGSEDVVKVGHAAEKVIMSDEFKSAAWSLMPIGSAYTTAEKMDTVTRDFSMRIGLGFLTMLVCLIIFVRSFFGVIVPFVATMFGIGTVLGFTGLLGIPADSDLMSLPVLLGMALSIGYALHYINAFKMHFRQTGKRKEAVMQAVEESGWPILFTVITTAVSLLSFMFANIRPMLWLGAVAASVVKTAITPEMLRVLSEIDTSERFKEYEGVYVEGKMIELTALVLYGIAYNKTDEIKRLPLPNKEDAERVESLREKIQRTPALEYDAPTVAQELGMSVSKLNRVFRAMYATSPHAYVQDKRLECAARLLKEDGMAISEAAQRPPVFFILSSCIRKPPRRPTLPRCG